MRYFLSFALCLALAHAPVMASIPQGRSHGAWHVVSISSISGTEGNDASVSLSQSHDDSEIDVRWTDGRLVTVSISFNDCGVKGGDDEEEFDASYSVDIKRWLRLSHRDVAKRLRADFTAWIGQAKLVCQPERVDGVFKMADLDAAVEDFTARLNYWAMAYKTPLPDADRKRD